MNNATFAGNIGQDCRINTVNGNQGQITVANFTLAVDKRKKDQNGNKQTLWIDCAIWGKRADALQQYLVKGQKVVVSGSVDVELFTKNDGQAVPKLNLMVSDLTLQGGQPNTSSQQYSQPQQLQQQSPQQAAPDFNIDSDVPF
jgi:single-strand DNA-binding protein